MNKLLMAGLLSAVVVAGAQAEGTVCHPGGFYAGLNVGFVAHKAQLKVKKVDADGTAAKILAEMKKAKEGWEAGIAAAQKTVDTATEANDTNVKAEKAALEAAKKAYADKLVDLYTATAAGTLKVGEAVLPGATRYDALTGFTKILFADEAVNKTLAAKAVDTPLTGAITAEAMAAYNAAVKAAIPAYVEKLFGGTFKDDTEKKAFEAALTTEKVFVVAAATSFAEDVTKTNTAYTTAQAETVKTTTSLTDAGKVLTAEQTKAAAFTTALGTDKEVKITDLASDATIATKVAEINKTEINELLANQDGKRSKTKGGFVAEANFGFDHRIGDMMVGAELFVGFDTSKVTLRDKKVTEARKAGTADKSVKDGIELKRQFYVGLAPRIGYMFTPELEGYFMVGGQISRYKINATGGKVLFDHSTNVLDQAKALNTAREAAISEAAKAKDEAGKKFYEGIHVISTEETFSARNKQYKKHNKTKFAPVIGVGIRYAFTPDIFGTLQYKYQFNTKVIGYAKIGDFQVKDQNHTVTVGVGFRF